MPSPEPEFPTLAVIQDGVVAGLIAAFVVALAHLVADAAAGAPLRTPTALGRIVIGGTALHGSSPDLQIAFFFSCVHLSAWVALGTVGSWLVSLVDARPRLLTAVFAGFVFFFSSALYAAAASAIPDLPQLHLWMGTLFGPTVAALYLARCHPKLAGHVFRESLSPTTLRDLVQVLALEQAGAAALEAAAGEHPSAALDGVLQAKRGRLTVLESLADDLDLDTSTPGEPESGWEVTDLPAALRSALESERRVRDEYDRYLYSVGESRVRDVFLRLRYHVVDSTIPQLEEALG